MGIEIYESLFYRSYHRINIVPASCFDDDGRESEEMLEFKRVVL